MTKRFFWLCKIVTFRSLLRARAHVSAVWRPPNDADLYLCHLQKNLEGASFIDLSAESRQNLLSTIEDKVERLGDGPPFQFVMLLDYGDRVFHPENPCEAQTGDSAAAANIFLDRVKSYHHEDKRLLRPDTLVDERIFANISKNDSELTPTELYLSFGDLWPHGKPKNVTKCELEKITEWYTLSIHLDANFLSLLEQPSSISPQECKCKFDHAKNDMINTLDAWLESLVGRRFQIEAGIELINDIRFLTRSAGKTLIYENTPVSIKASYSRYAKHVSIQLRTIGDKTRRGIYASTEMPLLRTG